jgi:micrococcal nuclease
LKRALLCLAVALVACEGRAAPAAWTCQLTRVIDGDTLHARCDGEKVKVRLLRIDTPEHDHAGFAEAKAALGGMIGKQTLRFEFERPGVPVTDEFDRWLVYAYAGERNLNIEMVRLGWSRFWTKYGAGRLADAFRRAEIEAREAGRGIWADAAPDSPGAAVPRGSAIAPLYGGIAPACRTRVECCRVCTKGVACGNSCISAERTCRQESGCACDREALCESR